MHVVHVQVVSKFVHCICAEVTLPTHSMHSGESVVSESTLKGGERESSVDREEASTDQQSEAVTQETVETQTTSTSSKYSIPWVKSLGYLRIYHDEDIDRELTSGW